MSFRIRQTAPEELGLLKQLAENEGLNPGLNDIASVYQADPAGFFTCLSGDKPAGFISAIKYGSRYGFIGLFLIYPEFRNTAAAPILFRTAYKYLAKSNAGMDIPFKFVARIEYTGAKFAHKIKRYEGYIDVDNFFDNRVKVVTKNLLPLVCSYDKAFFPDNRTNFLMNWLKMQKSFSFAYMRHREVRGYGMIRKCLDGWKVGPLIADHTYIADEILITLAKRIMGDKLSIDVPLSNHIAVELAKKYLLKEVSSTARYYTKYEPDIDPQNIYAVTSVDFG